jgi:signal transduction histidine kinase
LLLIARSDQGALPIRRAPHRAGEVLRVVADRFGARAADAGRAIEVGGGEDLVLDADLARLEQAVGNLVDNALTHGGGPVRLFARAAGELVELHVEDEGPGFATAFAERAFDRFSRADDARGRGGSGLGLSIVDLIARAHGGSAGAGDRRGGGADVWIAVSQAAVGAETAPPIFTARS